MKIKMSLLFFFSIMGIAFGPVLSEEKLGFNSDLSAENNFFRFKKAINHALPGQSFFRINFNSPHPDHGKGKILRPIGHEVVKTNKWTPIPKTHSDELQVQSRAITSTTESYKPNIEASSVEVSPKSEPSEINGYKTTSPQKGNVFVTKVTTASTSNPKQGSRTTYLTFKPVSEEKYEPTSLKKKVETAKKVINSQYNYKTVDNYTPSTSTYTTKYKEPESSYRETRQPSYSTTRKPVIVTLSQDYSPEPPKAYYENENAYEPKQPYVGVKVKSLPKPLYGKIEPYHPEEEYETYTSTYGKKESVYSDDHEKQKLQKYGFSYVGDEVSKPIKKFSYKVEKPQYIPVSSYHDEPKDSYTEYKEPTYERKPVYKPLKPKYTTEHYTTPKDYQNPSVEYHEHDLPAEIDIGHGYKLKLVYKPKKHKPYPRQYTATPKPSTNIYVSPHGSAYSEEKHRPSYETLKDHSNYGTPHKQENRYHEEIRYHETPKYHSVPAKTSHHSHSNYEPKNGHPQSTHFNKFQSNHFKHYSYKEAPRKYTFEFLKPGEVLNLSESLDSSPRNNEGTRDGRVFESESVETSADNGETTTVSDDMTFVEDTTTIQNSQLEDEIFSTTRAPFQSTMETSFPSTTISEQTETASTNSESEEAMTTTRIVELQPRTQSDIDNTTENDIQTTTEITTSTRNEDFTTTDITTNVPETDVPRRKRKSFGYSWYLEG